MVPQRGSLEATGDPFEPYRLVDGDGVIVVPVAVYLRELQASGRPAATQRSYAYDLLRWWRFLGAAGAVWDQATRAEARDFCRWIQIAGQAGAAALAAARRGWLTAGAAVAGGGGDAEPGDREARSRREVCPGHGGALRDGPARFL